MTDFNTLTDNVREIVVVDDDEMMLYLHKIILEELTSTAVETFPSGKSALAYILSEEKQNIEFLILLDINMPEMDGWEVLRILEAQPNAPRLSVVMVSSSVKNSDIVRSESFKTVYDYLSKPLTYDILSDSINKTAQIARFFY